MLFAILLRNLTIKTTNFFLDDSVYINERMLLVKHLMLTCLVADHEEAAMHCATGLD